MDEPSNHPRSNRLAARISPGEVAILIAAGALLALLRLHAFDLPLETDECNYAYIAKRLLAGDRLYVDVWDHQPFGVFALFAAVIALFGDAPMVFRWMALFFSLASLGLIYAIARRCAGRTAAVMAAVLFALASSDPGTAGEGCNREIYMNTLVLAAWYLALRARSAPGRAPRRLKPAARDVALHARGWSIAAAGMALAVASSLKTIVAVHWLFLAVWVAAGAQRHAEPGRRTRDVIVSLALFGAGPALLWLGSLVYFAGDGRLHEFVDAVFVFNLGYSAQPEHFFQRFLTFFTPPQQPFIFDSALGLWIGGLGGVLWLMMAVVRYRKVGSAHPTGTTLEARPVVLLAMASYVATCLPGRFWPHYYYLLIPALVLTASVAIGHPSSMVVGSMPRSGNRRWARRSGLIASCAFGILLIWLMATEWTGYVRQPPFGITVNRYNSRDFWGRAHGEQIRRITNPTDEIFVYGNEAEIYYYANRRCASRYTMITGLGEGYPGFQARRAMMLAELRRRQPRLILVLFDERPFDEWVAFLKEHYSDPIGWDLNDRTGERIMFVVARKDAPVAPVDWNWDRSSVGGWFPGEKP